MAELAARTAQHLGLQQRDVERCRLGGWLHDVGKLAISEQILMKPGPLDEAEWDRMRSHPAVGAAVVARVVALRPAAPGVRHHHERFAGGGYPDDLSGIAIPIEARIIAAADAYAAMTATRPYSAAEPPRTPRPSFDGAPDRTSTRPSSTRCSPSWAWTTRACKTRPRQTGDAA